MRRRHDGAGNGSGLRRRERTSRGDAAVFQEVSLRRRLFVDFRVKIIGIIIVFFIVVVVDVVVIVYDVVVGCCCRRCAKRMMLMLSLLLSVIAFETRRVEIGNIGGAIRFIVGVAHPRRRRHQRRWGRRKRLLLILVMFKTGVVVGRGNDAGSGRITGARRGRVIWSDSAAAAAAASSDEADAATTADCIRGISNLVTV